MPRSIEKLRDLGTPELESRERELAEQVFRLRFQLTTGQAEAVTRLRLARRDLARVKTLLRERELRKAHGNGSAESAGVRGVHQRKELVGVVTSAKMQKTIVVRVTRQVAAPALRPLRTSSPRNSTRTTNRARRGRATRCASWRRGRCRN